MKPPPKDNQSSYSWQYRKCKTCKDCKGHGPYLYKFYREKGKVKAVYLGKGDI